MALIPPFFLDCVVAIGREKDNGDRQWYASGFLYSHSFEPEKGQKFYPVFLVTNRHVLEGLNRVFLRFNPIEGEEAQEYVIDLQEKDNQEVVLTSKDPDIDIAVIPISGQLLKEHGIQFSLFLNEKHSAPISKMNELGITEGDFVYALGFPLGIVGSSKNVVVARGGIVARIRDTLAYVNKGFYIDAFIFPGNSGGPVVLKPETMAIEGTKPVGSAYLIGIVVGYVTYLDIAVSEQTTKPRIIFEENSGLAVVHPIDYVDQIIHSYLYRTDS